MYFLTFSIISLLKLITIGSIKIIRGYIMYVVTPNSYPSIVCPFSQILIVECTNFHQLIP